jgi:bifunctional non-homologous end joining protein LigD
MPLVKYAEKRDFDKTPEPKGAEGEAGGIFVVQEHQATHLHWDFRFELNGVLKSWAVPKGVPEEKNVKHLAVEVEDHPLEYATFHGNIPKGEYGAGSVKIWDEGKRKILEMDKDRYVLELAGKRLKGRYALVRFKGREQKAKNWLIMKI